MDKGSTPTQAGLAYYAAMTDSTDPSASGLDADLDEFRVLVRAAFEQALNSGKADWREMTSAVLKNRLLNLTNREFSQSRYGSTSFIQLVRQVADLIEVVDDKPPFRLRIKESVAESSTPGAGLGAALTQTEENVASGLAERDWRQARIREDLWRAIVDYRSHSRYVLDPDTGLARPQANSDGDLNELPTASAQDVAGWREQFVDSLSDPMRARFEAELQTWLQGRGRLSDLPGQLRGAWAEFFKRKVGAILLAWFNENGRVPPSDLFAEPELRTLPPAEAIEEIVRTRQLRNLIIRALRTMTYEELAELRLPAFVLLRVTDKGSSHDV